MASIRALRFYGKENVKVESIVPQKCGADDVRLKVAYCGICGTDVHEYLAGPIFPPQPGQKNPHTGVELPVCMGHEMSGTVIEVGSNVTGLKAGQEVTVNPSLDDRHHGKELCTSCKAGRPNICKHWAALGLSAEGGGFADEIVVKSFSCLPLPPNVSLKAGALSEPLAVAAHMIRISGFQKGQDAVILGAGPIGLSLLLFLKARGVRKVVISEVAESRAFQAKKLGADLVVNPLQNPVLEAVHNLIGADGVDVAYDATGIQSTLDTAIAVVKPGGVVFNVAIHEKPLLLNLNDLTLSEKKLMGGMCYTNEDFQAVLEALATGTIKAEDLVTSVVPLEKAVEGGFMELINNKAQHIKILIQPA